MEIGFKAGPKIPMFQRPPTFWEQRQPNPTPDDFPREVVWKFRDPLQPPDVFFFKGHLQRVSATDRL